MHVYGYMCMCVCACVCACMYILHVHQNFICEFQIIYAYSSQIEFSLRGQYIFMQSCNIMLLSLLPCRTSQCTTDVKLVQPLTILSRCDMEYTIKCWKLSWTSQLHCHPHQHHRWHCPTVHPPLHTDHPLQSPTRCTVQCISVC